MNFAAAMTIAGALIFGTWVFTQKFDQVITGQRDLSRALAYKLSTRDFAVWVATLDKRNRAIVPALVIPDPPTVNDLPKDNGN